MDVFELNRHRRARMNLQSQYTFEFSILFVIVRNIDSDLPVDLMDKSIVYASNFNGRPFSKIFLNHFRSRVGYFGLTVFIDSYLLPPLSDDYPPSS